VYGIPIGGQQGHSIVHGTRRRAGPSLVAEHLICSETFNGPLDVIYPPDFLLDSGGTASRRSYPDGYRTRVWSDTPRVPVMEYSRHLGPFHFCGQPLSGQLPSDWPLCVLMRYTQRFKSKCWIHNKFLSGMRRPKNFEGLHPPEAFKSRPPDSSLRPPTTCICTKGNMKKKIF
jgi:hypothetical protein